MGLKDLLKDLKFEFGWATDRMVDQINETFSMVNRAFSTPKHNYYVPVHREKYEGPTVVIGTADEPVRAVHGADGVFRWKDSAEEFMEKRLYRAVKGVVMNKVTLTFRVTMDVEPSVDLVGRVAKSLGDVAS